MEGHTAQSNAVLVMDFGSQYTHLITRRIRTLSIFSSCISGTSPLNAIEKSNPRVIILSGGPHSVHSPNAPSFPPGFFEYVGANGIFVLGICYGMQLIVQRLGGEVLVGKRQEYGRMVIKVEKDSALFGNGKEGGSQIVWMSHGDEAAKLPDGFLVTARSQEGSIAAIEDQKRRFYGLQYHPEVTHSPEGMETLQHYLLDICGLVPGWKMENVVEQEINLIKDKVGTEDHVVCALSGGVDSTVAATLVHRALGDRLHCIFVDNGLLRYKERERVMETFERDLHLPVTCVDASAGFLGKLGGVVEPEKKRKIIGNEFIRVFERFSMNVEQKLGRKVVYLVQGTLYPDVIESCPPPESGRNHSHRIKSHHNVGGLPENMKLKLIEPLKLLFKDEVRELGRILGVPESFLKRHPFPGPGLAVRVLGDVTAGSSLEILREVDEIFVESIRNRGLYDSIWQAFAVLLPIKSVGIQGDQRTYSHVVALRAVTSEDGMTADWYHFDHEFLTGVAQQICNRVRGINRVVQDITSKPPSTIEWE